jgi:hypothetical protein
MPPRRLLRSERGQDRTSDLASTSPASPGVSALTISNMAPSESYPVAAVGIFGLPALIGMALIATAKLAAAARG